MGFYPLPRAIYNSRDFFLQRCFFGASVDMSREEVIKCLGFKIIERVPPLSYLNRMQDSRNREQGMVPSPRARPKAASLLN